MLLNFKTLELDDKCIFDKFLMPYTFKTCEYSFTSLFIWRKGCDIQFAIFKDVLIIKKTDFNGKYHFLQPIGYNKNNLSEIIDELQDYKESNSMDYLFKDIETSFVQELDIFFPGKFNAIQDRDNFDYIYDSSKLVHLSGKKLHSKKNHLNNFVKNNDFSYAALTEDMARDCIITARDWCYKRGSDGYLFYELKAIEELLKNIKKLDILGMVVYVDNKLSAFTIGEKINSEMALIHIEKADATINGLYTFLNKMFIETTFLDVPLINREQDLGIEGLRHAKLSYQPYKLEEKYIIN